MGLQDGLYTGPAGRSLNDLGHFLSVSVEYASTAVVPEPGSWALLSLGLGVLLQVRRRQTRATQTRGCGQASEGRPQTHPAAPCAALNRTESP